jgi:hypothetical protein
MRPLVNTTDYFNNIKKYFKNLIIKELPTLQQSGLGTESYYPVIDHLEPMNSFMQMIKLDATTFLQNVIGETCKDVPMFSEYNPINEGLVMTDITFTSYVSNVNDNHFFHMVYFSVFNTTRYNTMSIKSQIYQDISGIKQKWFKNIENIKNGEDLEDHSGYSKVYLYNIDFVNTFTCMAGEGSDCEFKAYDIYNDSFPLMELNDMKNATNDNIWLQQDSLPNSKFNLSGNYTTDAQVNIQDNGPSNFDNLVKELSAIYYKS